MKQYFDLKKLKSDGGTIEYKNENILSLTGDKEGGRLIFEGKAGRIEGLDLKEANFLVLEITNMQDCVVGLGIEFWEEDNITDNPNMIITMGLMPGLKTVLSLPLEALNSQQIFLKRTPGKLKTVVSGKKVEIEKINKMAIRTMRCLQNMVLELSSIYLTESEPEYVLPEVKLVDELGQNTKKHWKAKTASVKELNDYLRSEKKFYENIRFSEAYSLYGGWKKKSFEATGYFRTQYDGRRWWMVDPEGYVFFSIGLDSITPGESCRTDGIEKLFSWLPEKEGEFSAAWKPNKKRKDAEFYNFAVSNLIRAFGENWWDSWAKLTTGRLMNWGINTVGNWSSLEFAKYSNLPYVYPLEDFPETEKKIFRDFPDVFSEEYKDKSVKFAKQANKFKEDRFLIGYFLRNEPHFAFGENINIAEELLQSEQNFATKEEMIKFLYDRYEGDIHSFNNAWKLELKDFKQLSQPLKNAASLSQKAAEDLNEFAKIMIREYIRVPSEALKAVDPNHMNLGVRYAWLSSENLISGSEYFDVFSFNCYDMNPYNKAEEIGRLSGKPVMIGEFHFGALDVGMWATGLRGVLNQKERGNAFRYYVENAASEIHCVGTHYFVLNDQALLGRYDGENYQIGCVDVCHKPYNGLIEGIRQTADVIYEVAEGTKDKYNIHPIEIERVY